MAEYMLSVHNDPAQEPWTPETMQRAFAQVDAFNEKVRAAGAWVFAGGLQEPDTATVVRATAGEMTMTDGPFAETKEHLGGFWVIDVADLDAALEWAKGASEACMSAVEVRPFQVEPES